MTFHQVIVQMISEYQNDFNGYLKDCLYLKNVYVLIKVENGKMLIGKNIVGESDEIFMKFPDFYQSKRFSRRSFYRYNVCQNCPNNKISTNNFQILQDFLRNCFWEKEKKGNVKEISLHFIVKKQ